MRKITLCILILLGSQAACAWGFWVAETFWGAEVPAAMVVQATTLLVGIAQIIAVNVYGVTTNEDGK